MKLPQKPEPAITSFQWDGVMRTLNVVSWSADQLRAYGEACARAALEQAARICDSVDNYANPMTAVDCADAIRELEIER